MKVNKTLCLDPLDIIVNITMLTNISDSGILKNTKIRNFICFNTCIPMVDSSQCMAKPIQCCKVK